MQLSRSKPVFTFDVGGVLIIWRNNNPILRYIAKRYGIPFSKARIVMSKVLPRFENRRINCSQFLKRSLAHFGRKLKQGDSPARQITLPFARGAKLRKGLIEIINSLQRKGYEVDGFSNTNNIHVRFMRQSGQTTIFHRFFASCYLGDMKPHLNAYRKVLAKIGAKPQDVMFIDNTRRNILGAKKAGIKHSFRFHSIKDLKKSIKRALRGFERADYLTDFQGPETTGNNSGIFSDMRARIETSFGTIEIELFENDTPRTVRNFVRLANAGFYTDLVFHRIVKGFVIQTGDPNTRNGSGNRSLWGTGGSDKTVPLEIVSSLQNNAGNLGMARSQDPNSGSSQFYINLTDNNSLNGSYTVFGRVTNGMQVVKSIASVPVDKNDAPIAPSDALIKSISIEQP